MCLTKVTEENDDLATKWKVIFHYTFTHFVDACQNSAIGHGCFIPYNEGGFIDEFATGGIAFNGRYEHVISVLNRDLKV